MTVQGDAGDGFTLRYTDHERLSEPARAALMGPGAPFEMAGEEVLGHRMSVFVNRQRNLRDVLLTAAERFGDRPYFVFPDETVTFAEAPVRIAAIAHVLAEEYGVGKGVHVAFASSNSLPYALTQWAVTCLGGIVVGLNGWWTGPELEYGIELTNPVVVFGDPPRLDRLTGAGAAPAAPIVLLDDLMQQVAALGDVEVRMPDVDLDEDDPFMILFTSGTTGRPKGATTSHRQLIMMATASALPRAVEAMLRGVTPAAAESPAAICGTPFFHISGAAPLFVTSVQFGNTLVFPPAGRWDAGAHLELTERHRVTSWSGVPTQFWRILEHPDFADTDVSSVMTIGSGGAPFPPELMRILNAQIPSAALSNGYGSSETVGTGTGLFGERYEKYQGSVGAPWMGTEIQVRDEADRVLPEGEIGEVCIRSAMVFLGYFDDPEATAEVFDDDRWYHTGDFGRLEHGVLWLESRMRDLILRGGENIYPMEIDHRLVEHPDIADSAVIGVPHRELGQEVKAFVVLRDGATLTEADVQEWAGLALARFKVPAYVEFRDSLPYTATGKVMKHELEGE